MVYNYDIYYKTGPKSAQSYRITKTALTGVIYNGVPDWLYEGELAFQQLTGYYSISLIDGAHWCSHCVYVACHCCYAWWELSNKQHWQPHTYKIHIMSIMANMNVKLDTFNLHVCSATAFCECHFKTKFLPHYFSLNKLYTEEILGSNTAIWMSNDGHLMLYGTFNDTNVMEQKFPWYGSNSENGAAELYPQIRSIRWEIFSIFNEKRLWMRNSSAKILLLSLSTWSTKCETYRFYVSQ